MRVLFAPGVFIYNHTRCKQTLTIRCHSLFLEWLIDRACVSYVITTEIFENNSFVGFMCFFIAFMKRKTVNNANILLEECLAGKIKNYFYYKDIPLLVRAFSRLTEHMP